VRRAHKVDSNQGAIVKALRACGASVAVTSQLGAGYPDLTVGWRGLNVLLEVKPNSKAKLTEPEQVFHATWRGSVQVVTSVDEALAAVGIPQG
jgi:hypothetical protein